MVFCMMETAIMVWKSSAINPLWRNLQLSSSRFLMSMTSEVREKGGFSLADFMCALRVKLFLVKLLYETMADNED